MANAKTKGLGRGFDSLLPGNFDASLLIDEHERVQKIAVADVTPNPNQPRSQFDPKTINELADSIKRFGILQPLIVTPAKAGKYVIVAGERRWRAAQAAGLKQVPVIVRSAKELEQLEIALVENVQRVDLSALEQARSIQKLHEQFNMDYDTIAKRLGKAPTTVINIARLLGLPLEAQEALNNKTITEGHARAILALKDSDKQKELLALIMKNGWSVRQAEHYVTAYKQGVKTTKAAARRTATTTPETDKLAKRLKTAVSIRRLAKGGRLEIAYKNETDLGRLIKRLLN